MTCSIETSSPHLMRCIAARRDELSPEFDAEFVHQQLRGGGVYEFPGMLFQDSAYKVRHSMFLDRYRLVDPGVVRRLSRQDAVDVFSSSLFESVSGGVLRCPRFASWCVPGLDPESDGAKCGALVDAIDATVVQGCSGVVNAGGATSVVFSDSAACKVCLCTLCRTTPRLYAYCVHRLDGLSFSFGTTTSCCWNTSLSSREWRSRPEYVT